MFRTLFASLAFITLPAAAFAQQLQVQAPPTGFSGEIVRFADDSVTLKDKDGKEVTVAMTRNWTVSHPVKKPSTAIKRGDFVATANKVIDDHTGESTEVRIMEPGYRPEYGTHLMAQGGSAMTHGTVDKASKTGRGVELDVSYPGGTRHLVLPGEMQITDFELLDRSVLKPGTRVGAVARKGEDGVLRAGRLTLSN